MLQGGSLHFHPSMSIYIHLLWRRGSRPWRKLPWRPALGAMSWWGPQRWLLQCRMERNELRSERVGSFFSLRVYLVKVSASNCRSIPLDFRVSAAASPQMSTIHVTMSCRKRECCNIPGPPYCVSSTGSQVARAFAGHPEKSSCWQFETQKKLKGFEIEFISHFCFQLEPGCWFVQLILCKLSVFV